MGEILSSVPMVQMNNGVQIPQVGYGVFQVPADEAAEATANALEAGYRLIDTAAIYGNEKGVGQAIADSGIPLDELFITTKLWTSEFGTDSVQRAFDASMHKLGLDVLDCYLIHWPAPAKDLYVESWQALSRLHSEGRVRSIGVSNFTVDHLVRLADETSVTPVLNQIELHPGLPQNELREYHAKHDILTQAWSPIGQGKGLLDSPFIVAMAERVGRTPAQVVLRWHLQQDIVVIPKTVTPSRMRENLELFDFVLSDEDMAELSAMNSGRLGPDPATFNP
jgi:2,5-diketo-D-gluconate reductase A